MIVIERPQSNKGRYVGEPGELKNEALAIVRRFGEQTYLGRLKESTAAKGSETKNDSVPTNRNGFLCSFTIHRRKKSSDVTRAEAGDGHNRTNRDVGL